jgi:hypothetical protein
LCSVCYNNIVDELLPILSEKLSLSASLSIENAAVRILRLHLWNEDGGGYPRMRTGKARSVGPALIHHIFGYQPTWAFEWGPTTMGALFAELARQHSMAPPTIEVVEVETYKGLLGGRKERLVPFTRVNAWEFRMAYYDSTWSAWIGQEGGMVEVPHHDKRSATGPLIVWSNRKSEFLRAKADAESPPNELASVGSRNWPELLDAIEALAGS